MTAAGPAHVLLEQPERPDVPRRAHPRRGRHARTPPTSSSVRDAARALGAATALVTQPYRVRGGRAPGSAPRQDAAWAELVDGAAPGDRRARRRCRSSSAAARTGRGSPAAPRARSARRASSRSRSRCTRLGSRASPVTQELRDAGTSVLVINGERDPFGVPEPDETDERRRAPRRNARPLEASGGDRRCRHRMAERAAVPVE